MAYLLARFICYLVWLPVVSSLLPPRLKVSIAAQACAALIVLISEGQDKRSSLFKSYTDEPPESTSSFMGNVLFLWINRVLAQGYSKPLPEDKIPVLDRSASSKGLRHAILRTWDQRRRCELTPGDSFCLVNPSQPSPRTEPPCPVRSCYVYSRPSSPRYSPESS